MTTHDKDKIIAAAKEAGFNTLELDWLSNTIEKFYAIAFAAGAASRDAEIAELKQSMKCQASGNYDYQEELKEERDALQADNARLRNLLAWVDKYVGCAISGSIKEALAATPEQSLDALKERIRTEVMAELADRLEALHDRLKSVIQIQESP